MRRQIPRGACAIASATIALGCGGGTTGEDGSVSSADAGPETTSPSVTRSGTRLQVRWWDGGDGALVFAGRLHDTLLDVDCTMQLAVDGRTRCLPDAPTYLLAYRDPACSQPATLRTACGPDAARFVSAQPRDTVCEGRTASPLVALGDALSERTYYDASDCAPHEVPAGMELVVLGEEVLPERFVGADLVIGEGERLAPYSWVADDGTVLAVSIYDRLLDLECEGRRGSTSVLECAPTSIALAGAPPTWADPACTMEVAFEPAFGPLARVRPCAAPRAAFTPSGGRGYLGYAHLGDEVMGMQFTGRPASCAPSASPNLAPMWLVGAPFVAGDFANVVGTRDGTGRLQAQRTQTVEGMPLAHAVSFRDGVTRMDCVPRRFADGHRCVSGTTLANLYFADADCTTAIVAQDASGTTAMAYVPHTQTDACDLIEVDAVYAVGALLPDGPVWARGLGGSCVRATPGTSVFYAQGDPIDAPSIALR